MIKGGDTFVVLVFLGSGCEVLNIEIGSFGSSLSAILNVVELKAGFAYRAFIYCRILLLISFFPVFMKF